MLDQHSQRVEHLETKRDDLAATRQTALADIETKRPELIRASKPCVGHDSQPHESFRNIAARSKDATDRPILASGSEVHHESQTVRVFGRRGACSRCLVAFVPTIAGITRAVAHRVT